MFLLYLVVPHLVISDGFANMGMMLYRFFVGAQGEDEGRS